MITQETIDRLIRFKDPRLPVVSVYARVEVDPAGRQALHSRVTSLLDEIRPLTDDNSVDREVRLSLRDDIARIREAASREIWKPGGAAFFSCSGRGFFEALGLPRPVRDRIVVDATPWIRPLVATLDEYHRVCAVVVDRGRARVWEVFLDEMREIEEFHEPTLRKPNYAAGFAEHRVRNKADELSKRHFRRVAALLDQFFRTEGFDLLVVGGHPHEVPVFTEFLSRDVRARLAGTFTLDMDSSTPADVRKSVEAIVEARQREEERSLVGEVLEAAAAGRPAALGLRACLWAGSVAAVQTLLVHDEETHPGVVCDTDGWMALSGANCPFCGEPTRPAKDVIDELVGAVIEESGTVRHIMSQTPLREHVTAASLRFPLPPEPASAD